MKLKEVVQKRATSFVIILAWAIIQSMVAINLSRLAKQLEELQDCFDDPQSFLLALHRFFSFYHQYSHRKQRDAIPESFMRQYDLPLQIVPQLELSLRQTMINRVAQSYAVVEVLWQDSYFESRDLACYILGQLPREENERVMEQVKVWLSQPQDRAVVASIFNKACQGILNNTPTLFRDLVKALLESPEVWRKRQGLFALSLYLPKAESKDLPSVYSMIRPFISQSDLQLQSRLAELVQTLATRSPGEVAYLLKEVLSDTEGPEIEQRLRSYLSFFEADYAESIHQAVKNHVHQRTRRIDRDLVG